MKKLLIAWFIFFCIFASDAPAAAEEQDTAERVLEEYAQTYGAELQEGIGQLQGEELDKLIPDFNVEELLREIMSGRTDFSVSGIVQWLFLLLWKEVFAVGKLMVFVLALSMLSAYLNNLHSGAGSEGVTQISYFACYALIAGIAAAAFYEVVRYGQMSVENMSLFMRVLVPLVISALVSGGAILSASVFEPTLLAVIEITLTLIKNVFIPMVLLSTAVSIVNGLSDKFNADKLVQLFNKFVKWGLSALLMIFVGVAGVQSLSSATADGLSVKVTKFAASNFIPVVGGILSDSVETVVNCSVVLKNAVGVTGAIVLAAIAAIPLVKIAASLIIFRLAAAVAQPIADPKIIKGLSSLAESIGTLFSMVAAVAVMFIIVLAVVVNAGNTAVMLGR